MRPFATVRQIARSLHQKLVDETMFTTLRYYSTYKELGYGGYASTSVEEVGQPYFRYLGCGKFLIAFSMSWTEQGDYLRDPSSHDSHWEEYEYSHHALAPIVKVTFKGLHPVVKFLPFAERSSWIEGDDAYDSAQPFDKAWRRVKL